jgi:hypothetical protein
MRQLLPVLALALSACEQRDWQGWVYPDRNNLADDIPIGAFSTLNQCGASARAVLIRLEERRDEDGEQIIGDYECGYKCKPDGGLGGLNVCERTER